MKVTIAASQMACSWDSEKNIEKAINIVHESADQGAQIILLQELFETPYFCIDTQSKHFDLARTLSNQTTIKMDLLLGTIGRVTYQISRSMRKNFISHLEILDLKFLKLSLDELVWGYAGISGFQKLQEQWH